MSKATNPDDALMDALTRTARGIASENVALEGRARGDATAPRPEGIDAELLAATAPLSDAVRAKILAHATTKPIGAAPATTPIPLASRWRRIVFTLAPLAAAAAVVFVVIARRPGDALPPYALEIGGSQIEMRDPPRAPNRTGSVRLGDEAPLVVVARPARRPPGAIEVQAFARRDDGGWTALPADVRLADEGSARVEVARRALDGVREIRIIVAPRGISAADARARAARGDALVLRVE